MVPTCENFAMAYRAVGGESNAVVSMNVENAEAWAASKEALLK